MSYSLTLIEAIIGPEPIVAIAVETTAPGATVGVSKPNVPSIPEVPLSPSKPESKTGSEIEINPNEY